MATVVPFFFIGTQMSIIDFIMNNGKLLSEEKTTEIDVELQRQILKNQKMQLQLKTAEAKWIVEMNKLRPCHLYPITISHDGLQWVCKSGVCDEAVGCGDSPSAAMLAFDSMWCGTNKEEGDKDGSLAG